jgi:hypothetical protein
MATELLLVNPKRRTRRKTTTKRRTTTAARKRVRRNPVTTRRKTRRIRRNPRSSGIVGELMTAGTGAAGAIALDLGFAYLPLPEQYKTGTMGTLAKMATAVAAGMVMKQTKIVKKPMADKIVGGALMVQAYSLIKSQLQQAAPQLPLGEYMGMAGALPYAQSTSLGYTNAAMGVPMAMGEYMSGDVNLSGEMDYYGSKSYF